MTPHQTDLRTLANWLLLRSVQDHAPRTTLSILARKAEAIRARHFGATTGDRK